MREKTLKDRALHCLVDSLKKPGRLQKAFNWLDPPEFEPALDEFRTSDVAREISQVDKTELRGMLKYLKDGNGRKEEEPVWYMDPEGHARWQAHMKWNGKDSGIVKREFVETWTKARDHYERNRHLEVDDRVQVTRSLYCKQGDKRHILEGWKGTVVSIDRKHNALISFDNPVVERYLLAPHTKFLQILKGKSDKEGEYVVDCDGLKVDSHLDVKASSLVGTVHRGHRIDVVEVVRQGTKLRGRIEDKPGPGWVTLSNLHTHKRWAVMTEPDAPTGVYRSVVRQDVYEGVEVISRHLHKLDAGMCVNVEDVVQSTNGKGVRGRITSPYTGWITLQWDGTDFALPEVQEGAGDEDDPDSPRTAKSAINLEPREKFGSVEDYILQVQDKLQAAICEHRQLMHEVKRIRHKQGKAKAAWGGLKDGNLMGKLKAAGNMTKAHVAEMPRHEKIQSIIPVDTDKDVVIATDQLGEYVVDCENTVVCSDMEFFSADKFCFLERGQRIKIVELAATRDGIWRRGRIQPAPRGFQKAWIGVVNLKDGKRIVKKV